MTPKERAEAAYTRWIAQVSDEVRRLVDGTPTRQLFIQEVTAAIEDAQQTVTLGSGTTEIPRHPPRPE
jgi:hypothetical protein